METAKMPQYQWIDYEKVYSYTMEFYSVTKKNEILSFTNKWLELENTTLSEI
jgi:hypothetical protein